MEQQLNNLTPEQRQAELIKTQQKGKLCFAFLRGGGWFWWILAGNTILLFDD